MVSNGIEYAMPSSKIHTGPENSELDKCTLTQMDEALQTNCHHRSQTPKAERWLPQRNSGFVAWNFAVARTQWYNSMCVYTYIYIYIHTHITHITFNISQQGIAKTRKFANWWERWLTLSFFCVKEIQTTPHSISYIPICLNISPSNGWLNRTNMTSLLMAPGKP